jgi:hypothetical protein
MAVMAQVSPASGYDPKRAAHPGCQIVPEIHKTASVAAKVIKSAITIVTVLSSWLGVPDAALLPDGAQPDFVGVYRSPAARRQQVSTIWDLLWSSASGKPGWRDAAHAGGLAVVGEG